MSANADEIILPTGQRLRYQPLASGVFRVNVGESQPLPSAASPLYHFVSEFELIEQTRLIPARPGLVFGATYLISSADFGAYIPMTMVTRFPPGGLLADNGMTFAFDRLPCDVENGKTSFQCYSFDHDFEMVPGEWHLELWCKEQIVADHAFTVTAG